jgi:FMN phosphatase YigB (HAD superfamily)
MDHGIMKIILFDLGQTLEDHGVLIPGAVDMLSAIMDIRDSNKEPPVIALISNFYDANKPEEVEPFRQQYYKILDDLKIRSFFEPLKDRVTLSTEVGVKKPDEKIFRTAIDKIQKDLPYRNVIFITEDKDHIVAARKYGMMAIRINLPGEAGGEVNSLLEVLPFINLFALT